MSASNFFSYWKYSCSTFPSPPSLATGSIDRNVCFEWDDTLREFDFNPITLTSGGCTDTGILIDYQISVPSALTKGHMKVSMNQVTNKFRVTGLSSGVSSAVDQEYPVTVTGTLPDGIT